VEDHLECQPDPSSVRAARLFVVDKLQEWHADDLVDSAALLTSELATNAVLHTRRPFTVAVRRAGSGVRVEVVDASEEQPSLRTRVASNGEPMTAGDVLSTRAADVESLFSGLGMVDAVASDWGTLPIPGKGKIVWFELLSDGRPEGGGGLGALRRNGESQQDLTAVLPPLAAEGLDGGHNPAWIRLLLVVVLLLTLAGVIYAGLWAGGILGLV